MGFSASVNAILRFLPKTGRQTFLYSATQTKSVRDLARLSLKHPEYLSVHAEASAATPLKLHQTAIMCPLEEKLDMLWSFIKTHLNTKTIVFLSTCKQVSGGMTLSMDCAYECVSCWNLQVLLGQWEVSELVARVRRQLTDVSKTEAEPSP